VETSTVPKPLTDRQQRFVSAYLEGFWGERFNATEAARRAGYAWPSRQGSRLLSDPRIAERVDAGHEELMVAMAPECM
jgi:phage terminase small subunit